MAHNKGPRLPNNQELTLAHSRLTVSTQCCGSHVTNGQARLQAPRLWNSPTVTLLGGSRARTH